MNEDTSGQNSTFREASLSSDLLAPAKAQADEIFKTLNALMDDVNLRLGKLDKKLAKIEQNISAVVENSGKIQ